MAPPSSSEQCGAVRADGAPWVTRWLDRHAASAFAHKTALIESDTGASIGYRALRDAVAAMNARLGELGVCEGDVILLCAHERIDLVVALLAALQRGAIAANVSAQASADDHMALIARLEPQWIVRDRGVEPFEAAIEQLGGHAADTDTPARGLRCQRAYPRDSQSARTAEAAHAASPNGPGAPAGRLCLFTSGSTGTPRAVLHGMGDLVEANRLYADAVLGLNDSDVLFSTSRLSFAYGFNSLHFALSRGATSVLAPRQARAEIVAAALERYRPSVFFAVPTVYRLLLERVPAAVSSLDSVRLWISAGEMLPRALCVAWRAATGREVIDGLGTTETLCTFISNRPGRCVAGSTGTAVEGFELALLDAEGRPVAEGEIGRLHVRGPTLAAGYWKEGRPQRSPGGDGAAAFHDGWFDTRDLFRRDAAGRYAHLGRANEVFKSGGLWVSPLRIEQVLAEHPAVHECAIVPASEWGGLNRIHAFVVVRSAAAANGAAVGDEALALELVAYAKQRLARHEHPHRVRFVDALPRSANGKLQRTRLHA